MQDVLVVILCVEIVVLVVLVATVVLHVMNMLSSVTHVMKVLCVTIVGRITNVRHLPGVQKVRVRIVMKSKCCNLII